MVRIISTLGVVCTSVLFVFLLCEYRPSCENHFSLEIISIFVTYSQIPKVLTVISSLCTCVGSEHHEDSLCVNVKERSASTCITLRPPLCFISGVMYDGRDHEISGADVVSLCAAGASLLRVPL